MIGPGSALAAPEARGRLVEIQIVVVGPERLAPQVSDLCAALNDALDGAPSGDLVRQVVDTACDYSDGEFFPHITGPEGEQFNGLLDHMLPVARPGRWSPQRREDARVWLDPLYRDALTDRWADALAAADVLVEVTDPGASRRFGDGPDGDGVGDAQIRRVIAYAALLGVPVVSRSAGTEVRRPSGAGRWSQ